MKKTLIAAGIAAVIAAPAAFADVSISGQVKVTYASAERGQDVIDYDNAISFKASEDLGNGMSAFSEITMDLDASENAASATGNKDVKVGLKGSFGTVVVGRMETFTEGKVSSRFDDGKAGHDTDVLQLESAITNIGRANAVAYVSPTINGFHVGVAAVDAADGGGFKDHSMDYAVFYDNGPLSIAASMNDRTAANSDVKTLVGSYTMGDIKFSLGRFDHDDNRDANIARIDYKMGNNSLLVGYRDGEAADGTDEDVLSVKLTHSMSKRTAVWVGYRDKDEAGTDTQVGHAGIIHKF
jgi:predicted porin